MKTLTYIFIFLFCGLTSLAQKLKADTIDYSIIGPNNVENWYEYKVIDDKIERAKFNPNQDFMGFIPASAMIKNFGKRWHPEISETDTIMVEQWDLDDKNHNIEGHGFARVKFNKTTNVFTTERVTTNKKLIIGKFKILKWTKSEVILLDLGNIQKFRRIYYFRA